MNLVVFCQDDSVQDKAQAIAKELGLSVVDQLDKSVPDRLVVSYRGLFLELAGGNHQLAVDFLQQDLSQRSRSAASGKELLLKACGVKAKERPSILDATAGLGRDAFILASSGCEVMMLERSPVLAVLLREAVAQITQARQIKLGIEETDALSYLKSVTKPFDVIYLDPMHPERKKSALVKINMRLLRELVGQDEDSDALLPLALEHATSRVVVKRPKQAPPLNQQTPSYSVTGKHSRFDVYLISTAREL